jgi:hypothetical protein
MASDPDGAPEDSYPEDGPRERGENQFAGFDEGAMYVVVRGAVKDALLDVLKTVVLVWVGIVVALAGVDIVGQASLGTVVFGALVTGVGIYLVAAPRGFVPPVQEWFR